MQATQVPHLVACAERECQPPPRAEAPCRKAGPVGGVDGTPPFTWHALRLRQPGLDRVLALPVLASHRAGVWGDGGTMAHRTGRRRRRLHGRSCLLLRAMVFVGVSCATLEVPPPSRPPTSFVLLYSACALIRDFSQDPCQRGPG